MKRSGDQFLVYIPKQIIPDKKTLQSALKDVVQPLADKHEISVDLLHNVGIVKELKGQWTISLFKSDKGMTKAALNEFAMDLAFELKQKYNESLLDNTGSKALHKTIK